MCVCGFFVCMCICGKYGYTHHFMNKIDFQVPGYYRSSNTMAVNNCANYANENANYLNEKLCFFL